MTRCASDRRVYFFEEPVFGPGAPELLTQAVAGGVRVVTPRLPEALSENEIVKLQRELLDRLLADEGIERPLLWFYTPTALAFARHLVPGAVVYDCMDELSAFHGAPPALRAHEDELFARADAVFTGGQSLYEAKRGRHRNVHAFPSSVDIDHFGSARSGVADPEDQAAIARPRLGFFGVVDERMDLALLDEVARLRPDWQLVMLGPVVKIDPTALPRRPNIHWLGSKSYADLPAYVAHWDVAMMPFARNASTEFISPTKTLEYMAAGKPVVSTAIRDVVRPYGEQGLVAIAEDAPSFVTQVEALMREDARGRIARFDAFLARTSWDRTWASMREIFEAPARKLAPETKAAGATLAT